jgi:hypothetical protein
VIETASGTSTISDETASGSTRIKRSYAVLVATFAASRIAYYVAGVRFRTGSFASAIQLLPLHLLRHDLVRSLWYLHSQPPGFNAFVGILLHVSGDRAWVFGAAYLQSGWRSRARCSPSCWNSARRPE